MDMVGRENIAIERRIKVVTMSAHGPRKASLTICIGSGFPGLAAGRGSELVRVGERCLQGAFTGNFLSVWTYGIALPSCGRRDALGDDHMFVCDTASPTASSRSGSAGRVFSSTTA